MTALYIHIPFCKQKCAYCDFTSFGGMEGRWAPYLLALEEEMKAAAKKYGRLELGTVFIGGGTPSLLPSDSVMHLMAMIRAFFRLEEGAEITVECNPGTLSLEKLRDYRDSGVNRLSLGMQAAQPHLLSLLGRIHDMDEVAQSVDWARRAGFKNLNLDLMYALPQQTMAHWVDTLKKAMSLNPQHLSLYSLILEEGTPLFRQVEEGQLTLPDEDMCLAMGQAAGRMLGKRGYRRYEISNYALEGHACRHNMVYWTRGDYLGLGLAAHSFMGGERFSNTDCLETYLSGRWEQERNLVREDEAWEETIMLGTRTARGVELSLLKGREEAVEKLKSLGLVEIKGERLSLTPKGMDVQNAVVTQLVT